MNTEDQDKEHEHKKFNGDGSPITVGGGGGLDGDDDNRSEGRISCNFDEGDYPDPEPQNDKKKFFKNDDWQIEKFKIYTAPHVFDCTADLPSDRDCTVVVHCHGSKDDVTIHGQPFGIEMDTRTYKKASASATRHTNPDANSYIFRVDLLDGANNTIKTWPSDEQHDFKKSDNCIVCTDHVSNSKFCT